MCGHVISFVLQTLLQLFERRGGAAVHDKFSTSHYALAHVPETEDPAWQVSAWCKGRGW